MVPVVESGYSFEGVIGFLTELGYPAIVAISVGTARALGMVLISPVFNRLGLTGMIRNSIAITMSLPLIFSIFDMLILQEEVSGIPIVGMLLKELLIGIFIGIVISIPFWAAEVAGEFVDLQRGSTMAQLIDPTGSGESGVTSTLLTLTIVVLFFISGGFLVMLECFYLSYEYWPVVNFYPTLEPGSVLVLLGILDKIMRVGMLMIIPLVVSILAADLVLGYVARMVPSLHVFYLSLPIKNLLFTFLMLVYIVFLIPYMLSEIDEIEGVFRKVVIVIRGVA